MALAPDGTIYYAAQNDDGELVQIFAVNKTKITAPPVAKTVTAGDTAKFTTSAIGTGTLTYRWQRNDGPGGAFVDIPHGTSASFSLADATLAYDGAKFRVEVFSDKTEAVSKAVTLTVT
jgi:hypothetical protein